LAQYPEHGEQEMMEPLQPDADLEGEVAAAMDLFIAWLRLGPRSEACLCASAILHYARDQQYGDLRSAVGPDTAWELCCRTLSLPDDAISIGSRTLANLLIY
jgi:hypothetical protein